MFKELATLIIFAFAAGTGAAQSAPQGAIAESSAPSAVDSELAPRLLLVKRVYVESFGDDLIAKQVQAMIISSLAESKRFIVTENREKADAVLKGTGLEKTSQEVHAYEDSTAAGVAAGGHSASISGSATRDFASISGSSSGGFVAQAASMSDASLSTETINDARVAVRLVDKEGDVIWATTQESKGAKYKGASADVADKVVKKLLRDIDRANKADQRHVN